MGGEYPTTWPAPEDGWTLTIGEPSRRAHFLSLMSFELDLPMAEHVRATSIATAIQAVNAIPALCAAPPGITTMADLPLIHTGLGFGHAPIAQPGVPEP